MTDSLSLEQKKSRRGLLALVGAGGAAAVAALLGCNGKAEAAEYTWTSTDSDATGRFINTGSGRGVKGEAKGTYGIGVVGLGDGEYGVGVHGNGDSTGVYGNSLGGVGVWGYGPTDIGVVGNGKTGVKGMGKPGVYGISSKNNGSGVKGEGDAPGSIGVFAKNNPGRRALRTKGQVQMDCACKKTLSNKSNLITLPTGVKAGTNAIVMAVVQGAPGNEALVRRAYRVDSTHIRIEFDKKPANPTAVGYWIVHTG